MSLPSITISDFTGKNNVSSSVYKDEILNNYISDVTESELRELIGDGAYIYIRDTVSMAQRYVDLVDGVEYLNTEIDSDGITRKWEGLKAVLVPLIYFHYVRDNFQNAPNGNKQPKNDNSNLVTFNNSIVMMRWNEGARKAYRLGEFLSNYKKLTKTIDSFADLGGGNYRIDVSSTFYLENGDTIYIGSKQYTVSNLVANTSFDISGDTGLSFSGSFYHYPFELVKYSAVEYVIG